MGAMVMVGIAACGGDDGSAVPDAPSAAEVVLETGCGQGLSPSGATMNSRSIVFACNQDGGGVTVTALDLTDLSSRIVYQDLGGRVDDMRSTADMVVFHALRSTGGDQLYALSSGSSELARPLLDEHDGRYVSQFAITSSFAYLVNSIMLGDGGYRESISKVDLGGIGQAPQEIMNVDFVYGTFRQLAISSEHLFMLQTDAMTQILFRIDLNPAMATSLYSAGLDPTKSHQAEFFAAFENRIFLTSHDAIPNHLVVQQGPNSSVLELKYLPTFSAFSVTEGWTPAVDPETGNVAVLNLRDFTYRKVIISAKHRESLYGLVGSTGDFAYGIEADVASRIVKYPLGPVMGP